MVCPGRWQGGGGYIEGEQKDNQMVMVRYHQVYVLQMRGLSQVIRWSRRWRKPTSSRHLILESMSHTNVSAEKAMLSQSDGRVK